MNPSTSPVRGQTASARSILLDAPELSEAEWKALKAEILKKTPAKRRPLVHYLLFRCRAKPACWPSDATIAAELGICERTVRMHLAELENPQNPIIARVGVSTRFRRAIFFTDHPACQETMTLVKEPGKNGQAEPPQIRQDLPSQNGKICRPCPAKIAAEAPVFEAPQEKPCLAAAANSRVCTREGTPPPPFASLKQTEAEQACSNLDRDQLTERIMALLGWQAANKKRAQVLAGELHALAGPLEKLLAFVAWMERRKANGYRINGPGLLVSVLKSWANLAVVECWEIVEEVKSPAAKQAAGPKTPGQIWVETLETDGFRLRVLPDGRFDAQRVSGEKPLNMTAVSMLRGQFRDSALEYLARREGGPR